MVTRKNWNDKPRIFCKFAKDVTEMMTAIDEVSTPPLHFIIMRKETFLNRRFVTGTARAVKSTTLWLAITGCLSFGVTLGSCTHNDTDEPEKTSHRPGNDSGGSGQNNGSSQNEGNGNNNGGSQEGNGQIETSPIVGRWIMANSGEHHIFDADGKYTSPPLLNGVYTYDDLHRWLYISIDDGTEVYVIEYKCLIDGDEMTWYDEEGGTYELHKEA